jgi:hypothetical protein
MTTNAKGLKEEISLAAIQNELIRQPHIRNDTAPDSLDV